MQIIKFDLTTFEDLSQYALASILASLFDFMESEISSGKIIVIERRYSNAPPDPIESIRNIEELNAFKSRF